MIDQPTGRYCKSCQYDLRGSVDPSCPECGQKFDPNNPKTYRLNPYQPASIYQRILEGLAICYPLAVIAGPKICYLAGRINLGYWPRASIDDPKQLNIDLLYDFTWYLLGFGKIGMPLWPLVFIFSLIQYLRKQPRNIRSLVIVIAIGLIWTLFMLDIMVDPGGIWNWFAD